MSDYSNKDEKLNFFDFDLLGVMRLKDVEGIESLVASIGNGEYYSRGRLYFAQLSCAQASDLRESLKESLNGLSGKKAFVVLDHMTNLSAKVYYKTIQNAIYNGNYEDYYMAKECLFEDVSNIIALFENKPLNKPNWVLPRVDGMTATRAIECSNMPLLYLYTKCFDVPEGYKILNAGLGGIYIGPFFKAIHDIDWTNLLKSKYVDEQPNANYDLINNTTEFQLFNNGKVLFLDDNIGTGDTAREIETEFNILGYEVKYGAIQYNWRNFYLVGAGEKNIKRFSPKDVDYLNFFNFPGHKLIKHGYAILAGNRDLEGNEPSVDNSSPHGQLYSEYLKGKSYDNAKYPDIYKMFSKGMINCENSGIKLIKDPKTGKLTTPLFTSESIELIDRISKALGGFGPSEMERQGQGPTQ